MAIHKYGPYTIRVWLYQEHYSSCIFGRTVSGYHIYPETGTTGDIGYGIEPSVWRGKYTTGRALRLAKMELDRRAIAYHQEAQDTYGTCPPLRAKP